VASPFPVAALFVFCALTKAAARKKHQRRLHETVPRGRVKILLERLKKPYCRYRGRR